MTQKEAAKLLGISVMHLRNLRQAGLGPKCQLKRERRTKTFTTYVDFYSFEEQDLVEWAKAHKWKSNTQRERFK